MSTSELREELQNDSENEDLTNFLSYLQDSLFDDDLEWEAEDYVRPFLIDSYLILSEGTNDKKAALKEFFPDTYQFVSDLIEKKIAEPYLFWCLSHDDFFNRCAFDHEHDSRVLSVAGNLLDPASLSFLIYPNEFKPLPEVDPDYIYNIESGQFALTNELMKVSDLSSIGFETHTGMGDGFYPTIPFFDHLGELQMITTFFHHMIEAESLELLLNSDPPLGEIHSHQLPLEMGYLNCDGSLFFGDSSWFHNGPSDDLIIEFCDLPVGEYLVVRFIDTESENRTWAVSVMRDKAKRNFEVLFKVFPELTNRNDDF
jgi:hypothetical protein